jgi:hypothetical protein
LSISSIKHGNILTSSLKETAYRGCNDQLIP